MADETSSPEKSRRRRRRPPVPLEIIQKHISVSMAQVIVNMTDPSLQAQCMQLLQISDVTQADAKILEILQNVDAKQDEKRKTRRCRKQEQ